MDFAILNGDPLNTPTEPMLDIHIEQTYVGGQLVYERSGSALANFSNCYRNPQVP